MLRTLKIWFVYSLRSQLSRKFLNIAIAVTLVLFVVLYQVGVTDKKLSIIIYILLSLILTSITSQTIKTISLPTIFKNNIFNVLLSNKKTVANYLLWIIYVPLLLAFFSDMFFQINTLVVILIVIPYVIIKPLATTISSFFIQKLK